MSPETSTDWKRPVFSEVDDLADMRERKARRGFLREMHAGGRGERYRAALTLWMASLGLPDPLAVETP